MRWVRANRNVGSTLALFALALQTVLSFGHVHLDGINGRLRSVAVASFLAVPPADTRGKIPSRRDSQGADDYCAICASVHLASTSLVSEAPQLSLPSVSRQIAHSNNIAFAIISPRRALFQSRAPPVA